jgi:serine/threonine protein kinase
MAGLEDKRLGAFHLIDRIGSGGMAEVYRARQLTAFGRDVAIKVIRPEFSEDETFRTRFLREAYAISRLSHPNILPLIQFGDENGLLYLVMPWVREGTLRDLLKRANGPLALEVAIPLFVPLCNAVQYAHEEGIIHRDIKPQNVLLQRGAHVLLTDFGIAHNLAAQTQITATGVGIGSVEYMAPEQAHGQSDARSDIYSLGVVLYQLLTGTVPFSGTAPLQVLLKHSAEPLPDLHRLNPSLPLAAIQIVQKALAKDPQQRFASAQALGHALQQIKPEATPDTLATNLLPPANNDLQPPPSEPPFGLPLPLPTGNIRPIDESQRPTEGWNAPPAWGNTRGDQRDYQGLDGDYGAQPPDTGGGPPNGPQGPYHQPPPPRGRGPLIIALIAALILLVALSSLTFGYLGLGWFQGKASHGSQQITDTPTASNTSTPSATATQMPTNTQQPITTGTPAPPTDTPAAGPTDTPSAPTDTPTGPTDTSTPGAPTDTPTPGAPTDTPTPGAPTDTPTP